MINKQPDFSAKNFYKNSANCQIKNSYFENLKTQIAGIDGRISCLLYTSDAADE